MMPPPPGVEAEWQMLPKCSLIERLPSPDAPGSWTGKKKSRSNMQDEKPPDPVRP